MATTQHDVEQLQSELEQLRALMIRDREAATDQINALMQRARSMREESEGGQFEVAVRCVHDLLTSLKRGLDAQRSVTRTAEALQDRTG